MTERAYIPTAPIVKEVELYCRKHGLDMSVFCASLGMTEGAIRKIRKRKFIDFNLADKILCKTGNVNLWKTIPQLAKVYKKPIPYSHADRPYMDDEEKANVEKERLARQRKVDQEYRARKKAGEKIEGELVCALEGCDEEFLPKSHRSIFHSRQCWIKWYNGQGSKKEGM